MKETKQDTAEDITQHIYQSLSKELSKTPMTKLEAAEEVRRQAQKIIGELPKTAFCTIKHNDIKAQQNPDGSIAIDYLLTTPGLQKTYSVSLDLKQAPILKYLSRCETCRTATGKLKIRWFWKSGIVTDLSSIKDVPEVLSSCDQEVSPDAQDKSSTTTDAGVDANIRTSSEVPTVDAVIRLDDTDEHFELLRGVSAEDPRIVDGAGAVVLMHDELSSIPDSLFAKLPKPLSAADVLELVADINYRNNLPSDTSHLDANANASAGTDDVEDGIVHKSIGTVTCGGVVTVLAPDPTYHHGIVASRNLLDFTIRPLLVGRTTAVAWNKPNAVFDQELDQGLSNEDRLRLEKLAQQFIAPFQPSKKITESDTESDTVIDLDTLHTKEHAGKSGNRGLAKLRKKLLAEHSYSDMPIVAGSKSGKQQQQQHKASKKQRARELQQRVTEAVEYTDAFTERVGVDTEAGIRYRLERVQHQLKHEAEQRLRAGEEDLPRASSRYYKAVFDELNRQLEQCERFNVWAEKTATLHNIQQQQQRLSAGEQ